MERLDDLKKFDSLPLIDRFSRTKPLEQLYHEFTTSGNKEAAKVLLWEFDVLDDRGILQVYSLEPPPNRDSFRKARLVELRSNSDALDYFILQVDQCSNPLHQALQCNFVWESLYKQRDQNTYRWGRRAAQDMMTAAKYVAEANWGMECVACLCRSIELSLLLNDRSAASTWLTQWELILKSLDDDKKHRWRLDVIKAVLVLHKRMVDVVNEETLRNLATITEQSVSHYEHQALVFQVAIHFAELTTQLYCLLGETKRAEEFVLRKCQVYEHQIEYMLTRSSPSGGAELASLEAAKAITAYQDAYSLLTDPGLRTIAAGKIEALKLRVRDLNRQAADEFKLIPLKTKLNIPELFQPMVKELFSANRTHWMSLLREQFPPPSLDEVEREVERLSGGLSDWIPIRTSVGDRSLGFDKAQTFRHRQFYELRVNVYIYGLMHVFDEVRHLGVNLLSYLRREIDQKLPDRDTGYFFDAAAYYWESNEYVAGLHILAPLCERLFKAMIERADISTLLGQQQEKQEEASLGKLLDPASSPKVCQLLNADLIHFLRYAWVNEPGRNLRNRVAHGWVQPGECGWDAMMLLFWTMILTLGIESAA